MHLSPLFLSQHVKLFWCSGAPAECEEAYLYFCVLVDEPVLCYSPSHEAESFVFSSSALVALGRAPVQFQFGEFESQEWGCPHQCTRKAQAFLPSKA